MLRLASGKWFGSGDDQRTRRDIIRLGLTPTVVGGTLFIDSRPGRTFDVCG
jgi:hypothetical protein